MRSIGIGTRATAIARAMVVSLPALAQVQQEAFGDPVGLDPHGDAFLALRSLPSEAEGGASLASDRTRFLGGPGAGQILLGDRAYDSDALPTRMAAQGAWANLRPMPNRKRVPAFSPFLYRYRNEVERLFSKVKHFQAVAIRYNKDPDTFLASVKLAAMRVWLRAL